ncbi:hypothetical protein KPH14_003799 [Odynerus spinipes]|uniref:THAP-type domain-containing protein n=1 Tax=Odynerus spinipes TaxID=1348599 RepID=A0AAD9RXB5_9HYME|nr:hypothetical protein KPH14_003799 [Odynerus spinipes]
MPTSCSVYGCSNRFSKEKKIQFFTFPFKDEHRLAAWVTAVHRKDWKPSKASRICSAHFRPQDFLHRPSTAWYPYIRRLKHDAIPSVFSNFPERLGYKKTRAKKENCTSAAVNRELQYSVKQESNCAASRVHPNGLKSCSKKLNPNTVGIKEETEADFMKSKKDQMIFKLQDQIRILKQQIIKKDRRISHMKESILRLRRHGKICLTLEYKNRMCRRSVAPHIS